PHHAGESAASPLASYPFHGYETYYNFWFPGYVHLFPSFYALQNFIYNFCNLIGQQWRDGVSYLVILSGTVAFKFVIIRESLEPCSFTHCQASALQWVIM